MSNVIDSFQGEYRFLSNFWLAEIEFGGILYPSSEHAYQAQKFIPERTKRLIANTPSPGKAKRLGRGSGMRDDWDTVKDTIMAQIVYLKFTRHPDLRAKLIATGDAELIEGNTWGDTYWGVCRGVGQNKLGKLLMELRTEFKENPLDE